MEDTITITQEMAESQFNDWAENNGLEFDSLKEEALEAINGMKNRLITNIQNGSMVVKGEDIEYTVSRFSKDFAGQKLTIHNPGSKLIQVTDGLKETQAYEKTVRMLSACTNQDVGFFRKLHIKDFRILEAIVAFFQLV